MSSKDLVVQAFRGEAERIPLYFWLADPALEAKIGDMVGARCWFTAFDSFLSEGGPFSREDCSTGEWLDRLDPDQYRWPSADLLVEEASRIIEETVAVAPDKSCQAEFIGPTELSEYSCSPGLPRAILSADHVDRSIDQVSHRFDFAALTLLRPKKADKIYRNFFNLTLQVVAAAAENDLVDSIRIADDFCDYRGSVYSGQFTQVILDVLSKMAGVVRERGKLAVLHSDGNLLRYLDKLGREFDGLHPLDVVNKSTVSSAHVWAEKLGEIRRSAPNTVFFTGIPIDLLCNEQVSTSDVLQVVEHVVRAAGSRYLVLTTTHRPYPGWTFEDFREKARAIRRFAHVNASSKA